MPSTIFRGNVVLPTQVLPAGVVIVADGRIVDVRSARIFSCRTTRKSSTHTTASSVRDSSTSTRMAAAAATTWMARPTRFAPPIVLMPATARPQSFPPPRPDRRPNSTACSTRSSTSPIRGPAATGPGSAASIGTAPTSATRQDRRPSEGLRTQSRSRRVRAGAGRGIIRSATCAAELPGAVEFCRAARAAGCLVTCGHSEASWPEMEKVFEAGMRHVDHFWNAMSSTDSIRRRLGTPQRGSMAEFVLYHPEMSTEVIADGHHHAPEMLQFAFRMKGPTRLCLVSDCSRALDMPPGLYRLGHQRNRRTRRTQRRRGRAARHRQTRQLGRRPGSHGPHDARKHRRRPAPSHPHGLAHARRTNRPRHATAAASNPASSPTSSCSPRICKWNARLSAEWSLTQIAGRSLRRLPAPALTSPVTSPAYVVVHRRGCPYPAACPITRSISASNTVARLSVITTESVLSPICRPSAEDCDTLTRLGWPARERLLEIIASTTCGRPVCNWSA